MKRYRLALLALSLFSLPVRAAVHPNTAGGAPVGQALAAGGIDSVNLFNGSLTISVPIGPAYPVNGGFSYRIQAVYNSGPWSFETVNRWVPALNEARDFVSAYPNPCANAGMGWRVSFGRINPPCLLPDANTPGRTVYQDEMGTDHVFYPTLHPGEATTSGTQYTRDGSYLRLKTISGGYRLEQADGSYRIFDAAGMPTEIRDAFGNGLAIGYATPGQWVLTDSVGRVHTIHFRTDLPRFPQAVDHIVVRAFGGATAQYDFAYHSAQAGRACPHSDNTAPGARGDRDVVPFLVGINLPDGTSYFNATASNYLITPATGCTPNGGNILSFTLPTGAEHRYSWQTYKFPTGSSNRPHLQQNPGLASRQVIDPIGGSTGTWTYQTSPFIPTGPELKNTVIDPLGHKSERFFTVALDSLSTPTGRGPGDLFDYGLPFTRLSTADGGTLYLSSRIFENTGTPAAPSYAGSPTRSEYVAWERDPIGSSASVPDIYNTNRRPYRGRVVYHDDGGSYAETVSSDFDGLGHYRRRDAKGSGFPGISSPSAVLRTETSQFNPARGTYAVDPVNNAAGGNFTMLPAASSWVLTAMSFTRLEEGGQAAQTDFCYQPNTAQVIRTRVRRAPTGAQSGNDLVAVVDLNEAAPGQPPVVRGNAAHELSYGGDAVGQNVIPVGVADLCAMALPAPEYQMDSTYSNGVKATSKYASFSVKTLDRTIDPNTGLPASSRDSAGLQTDYEYDSMGRMTWSKPAANQGGWTQFAYFLRPPFSGLTPSLVVRQRGNGSKSAAILEVNQSDFDGLGRVYREFKTLPGGVTSKRETKYDGAGHQVSVSTWFTGPSPATRTEAKSFDAFGRARQIVPPDGAGHAVDLAYTGVRQMAKTVRIATSAGAESTAVTTEVYDRFGRLNQVIEPSGGGGSLVTTTYGYDVGSRLTSVWTPTASGNQSRTVTYDRAGLAQSETQPEKGTNGNGTVWFPKYDSRGHLLRKQDGSSDLTYVYDKAERLSQVKESVGPSRVLKSFTWSDAGASTFTDPQTGATCTNYPKGKLAEQSRFNYVTVFGNPFKVEIREAMTYCGRDGRLSRKTLENRVNDAMTPNESFVWPGWTYDPLGNVTTVAYPQCTHAACATPAARTIQNTFTDGFLSQVGVPGTPGRYASGIAYHPSGMVSQVVHANNPASSGTWVTDTQGQDPSGLPRVSSIVAARGGTTLWTTESYGYDGLGNVKATGGQTFVYDKVSRLTQANLRLDATPPVFPATWQTRTESYSYDPFGNLLSMSGAVNRTIPIDSATNHLALPTTYDTQGSLATWNGSQFESDPFQQVWHFKTATAGDEWFYLYSADDERVWSYRPSANSSLWTLRDQGDAVLREYVNNGTWTVQSDLVYRDGQLLAAETSSGLRHFHLDHLGTPRLITDGGGNATAYHVYYPFGEEATAFNQDALRQKLTGHERDLANLGGPGDDLDYLHARFFSPVLGRFLSPDLADGNPSTPQTWSRYAYVMNRPLTFVDPEGLFAMPLHFYPPNGMALDDYGVGLAITVTAYGGTTGNTATGQWGATLLAWSRGYVDAAASEGTPLTVGERILSSIDGGAAQTAGDFISGFGDIVSFGVTKYARHHDDLPDLVNEKSTAFKAGEVAGVVHGLATAGLGASRSTLSVVARRYPNAGGGGVTLLKNGRRIFGIDWHKFGLNGKLVNRLHYHLGSSNRLRGLHRPWQGGWW